MMTYLKKPQYVQALKILPKLLNKIKHLNLMKMSLDQFVSISCITTVNLAIFANEYIIKDLKNFPFNHVKDAVHIM